MRLQEVARLNGRFFSYQYSFQIKCFFGFTYLLEIANTTELRLSFDWLRQPPPHGNYMYIEAARELAIKTYEFCYAASDGSIAQMAIQDKIHLENYNGNTCRK